MSCSSCGKSKSVTSVVNKAKTIANAWYNVVIEDEKVEILAKARQRICDSCNFKKPLISIGSKGTLFVCSKCNCPIIAKIRSNEHCPIDLW